MQRRGLWFSSALYGNSVSYSLAHASLHYSGIEKLKDFHRLLKLTGLTTFVKTENRPAMSNLFMFSA